jgi:type II secretory pathway predicted ATPase ExeA
MFERHFGLRENPFASGHQARFVYPSREHQEALAHLRFGIENREPFVLITGEVGTGKTTALYDVLAEWESRAVVALITNSALKRDELLEEICLRFGIAVSGALTKPQALVHLERFLQGVSSRGHRAILLLDEAQNLDRELLEEIRLLSNLETQGDKMLQVFLVGQPELEAKLARPELRQLRQRITVSYRLNPLSAEDSEHYIHHRLSVAGGHAISIFPSEACVEVHAITHGIPREINTVAAQALLNAFVEDSPLVLPQHVRAVAQDTEFTSVLRPAAAPAPVAPPPVAAPPAEPAPPPAAAASPVAAPPAEPAPPPLAAAPPIATPPAEPAPPPPAAAPPVAPPAAEPSPPEARMPPEEPPARPAAPGIPALGTSAPGQRHEAEPPARPPQVASTVPHEIPQYSAPLEVEHHIAPTPIQIGGKPATWESWLASLGEPPPAEETAVARPQAEPVRPDAPAPPFAGQGAAPESRAPAAPSPPPAMVRPPAEGSPSSLARAAAATRPPAPAREFATHPPFAPARPAPPIRRRLEFVEDKPQSDGLLRWTLVAAAVAVIVVGTVLAMRLGTFARKSGGAGAPTASPAASTTPPGTTPAVGSGPPQDETQRVPEPAPPAVAPTPPAPAPVATNAGEPAIEKPGTVAALPPAGTAPSATQAPSEPVPHVTKPARPAVTERTVYGVAVGTYLNEDRAVQERIKLVASTRLPSRILTVTEDNVSMFRLVLGAFEERDAAESAASDLIEKGLVDEARVVPLGKTKATRP